MDQLPGIDVDPSHAATRCIVIMGVSGSGKSRIGRILAGSLAVPFLEGDELHPPANVAKMATGTPLDDTDRAPWIASIRRWIVERGAGGGVVSCSALKRVYRNTLRADVMPAPAFVLLNPSRATLVQRLSRRVGHFMPASMLDSQIATLECPDREEHVFVTSNEGSEAATVAAIAAWLDWT